MFVSFFLESGDVKCFYAELFGCRFSIFMIKLLNRLLSEEYGVTLIEYALIGTLIAMAVVIVLNIVGDAVKTFYDLLASDVKDAYSRSQ